MLIESFEYIKNSECKTFAKTCQVSYAGMGDFRGMSPGSNLTGLISTYADWIVSIHKEPGTQDYYEDLSGFIRGYGRLCGMPLGSNLTGLICAYVMRIEIMDMKLGTHNFSEDLSGFIRGYGRLSRYVIKFKPDRSYLYLCWLNRLNTCRTRNTKLFRRPVRFHTRVWELLRYATGFKPDRSHKRLCWLNRLNT